MDDGEVRSEHPADQTYGPGAGRYVVPVLVVAGLVAALLPLNQGHGRSAVTAVCWVVALGVAAQLLFVRPSVRVDVHGVLLRNPLRDVVVPWQALVEVRTRGALTLVTTDGSYVSWAAPAAGRPRGLRSLGRVMESRPDDVVPPPGAGRDGRDAIPASRGLHGDAGAAAFVVESGWERWRVAGGTGSAGDRGMAGGVVITRRPGLAVAGLVAGAVGLALSLPS